MIAGNQDMPTRELPSNLSGSSRYLRDPEERPNTFVRFLLARPQFTHLLERCFVDGTQIGGSLATIHHLVLGAWPVHPVSLRRGLRAWARRRFRGGGYDWKVEIADAPPRKFSFPKWKEPGVVLSVTAPSGAVMTACYNHYGSSGRAAVFFDGVKAGPDRPLRLLHEVAEAVDELDAMARAFILAGVMLPAARALASEDARFTFDHDDEQVSFQLPGRGTTVEILPPAAGCSCIVKVDGLVIGCVATGEELTALLEPHAEAAAGRYSWASAALVSLCALPALLLSGCAYHTTRSYSNTTGATPVIAAPAPVVYEHYRVIPRYPDYPPYRRDSLALYRID